MTDYPRYVPYDPTPSNIRDTAYNTRKAAKASEEMTERVGELVVAMKEQLAIAKQSQEDAERSERFTRITAIISLAVAVASLGAAIAAVLIGV